MNIHVIHFGLNYPGSMNELRGCANDARFWARDNCDQLQPASCTTIVDTNKRGRAKLDREGIIAAGRTVLHRLEPGDEAHFYLSSHGTRERHGGRYVEAVVCECFDLIYDFEMAELFADRVKGSYVFAFLDCCHSGTMHRGMVRKSMVGYRRLRSIPVDMCLRHDIRLPSTPPSLPNCFGHHGCQEDGYCYDAEFGGVPQGAFSYYGRVARRTIGRGATYRDWYQRVAGKRPRGYLPNDDYDQQPMCVGSRRNLKRLVPFA